MDSFWFSLAIILLMAIPTIFATLWCPNVVVVEEGTNFTIKCETDRNISYFYWYKGKASNQDLVGRLEDGNKNIPAWYKDSFDVTGAGALVILKAGIEHETLYNLVTFDSRGSAEKEEVFVNITVLPDPSCPLVSNCTPCMGCELIQYETSGTFTCRVDIARPQVPLRWNVVHQAGTSLTKYPNEMIQANVSRDTWNSSITLHFEMMDACGSEIILQCVAEDPLNILKSTVSTINVTKVAGQCDMFTPANIPHDGTQPSKMSVSTFVVPLLLIAVLFTMAIITWAIYRRTEKRRKFRQLIWSLRERYRKFCFIRPLQKGEDIHIDDLYAEGQCTVRERGNTVYISTEELRANRYIFTNQWVVIIAEHGYGRTTFLKKCLQEWIKEKGDSRAMVYISLRTVKESDRLSKIIVGDKHKASSFTTGDIEKMLRTEEFVIMLDGYEDLDVTGGPDDQDKRIDNNVTIGHMLKGQAKSAYPRLHVWVSTCEEKSKRLPNLSDKMEIKMTGFSKEQVSIYMHLCCKYYYEKSEKKGNPSGKNDASEVCSEYFKQIECFFEENKITTKFKETPLLVNLMLHILAANYTAAVPYLQDKTIKDMDSLMYFVIDSMEARYKYKKDLPENTSFSDLKKNLGHFAKPDGQSTSMGKSFLEDNIGEKEVATALEIGLLKYSKGTDSKSKNALVEFYHHEIGKYLS